MVQRPLPLPVPGPTTATVLFTDLVGSTELRGRVGDQAAEELRREHDRLLTGVVEARRGQVVKGLGDGIMATFAGATDAVAAAVAVQQAIDRHNRSGAGPEPLTVRIGISAGDVTFEQGDCFGTPVIEAARLCDVASGGQILASGMVRWLVRGGEHRFSPVGEFDLKGLPEPVPTCEVVWEPVSGAAIPLPALLTDVGRIFVGRDDELSRLGHLWKEAATGERRAVLVAGEPGVGKTRLGAQLARQVHEEGATVLGGRCDEDLGVPFQPFVEALRHLVDHVEPSELPKRLGRHAGELERLLPGLRDRLPDAPPLLQSDPETERYRLFEAVTAWLGACSHQQPVLVILDDLQWAAKPTLLLLRHIASSPEPMKLLIVGTYRDTDLHHDHPLVELLADLRRQPGIERLSLSGFDHAAVADFMAQAAGHDLDEEGFALVRAIHAETEGNPFFVREILRHLTETGAVIHRDGRFVTRLAIEELGIPEGVREVVGRRVSRLSSIANQVLRVAAVVGTEFELAVVGRAGDFGEDAVLTALEEAIAARLLLEVPGAAAARYRFAHALVRDTLYDQLSAARRVGQHRRIALVIEELHGNQLDDHLPALAHHWARGAVQAAETALAVDYAVRAGDRALAQLAADEAAAYYRHALELREVSGAPADRDHCRLLIALGEAQRRAGDPAHRETLLDASHLADELSDAGLLTGAALTNRRGLFSYIGPVDQERVAAIEVAVAAVGPADSPERARLLAALATELHFAGDERPVEFGREGLAIARRLGETSTLAEAVEAVWLAVRDPAALGERAAWAEELTRIVEQVDDPVRHFHAAFVAFLTASEQGDLPRADQELRRCDHVAREVGQPLLRWRATYLHTHRAFMDGQLDEAERSALEALRIGEMTGQPDARGLSDIYLVRILQGRVEEAVELIRRLDVTDVPVFPALFAWACAEADRIEEAKAVLTQARQADFGGLRYDYLWLGTLVFVSRACARLGDAFTAKELYERLRPHHSAFAIGQAVWLGPVAYDLGLLASVLGHYDDADAHFAEAVELHHRVGVRGMLAHTHLAWARMLLLRRQPGDVERAWDQLRQAQQTASQLGLANIEEDAAALLRELT
jgi:class 3 adenylate cyclase/tetratricopeptide (TPR) repeat protein